MKINSSINFQDNNWADTSHHINRDFKHDSNKDIDPRLSHYNLSTDGHYSHGHFRKNHKSFQHRETLLKDAIITKYGKWITRHNNTAKGQHHSNRIISGPMQHFIGKVGSDKRDKVERTFSEPISNINDMATIVMRHQHISRKKANKSILRQLSKALYMNDLNISKRFPHILITHYGTNVDEHMKPHSSLMDAVHTQGAIIGLSWTRIRADGHLTPDKHVPYKSGKHKGQLHIKRGSKPSISVDRAICQDTHVPYSRKTKLVHRGNQAKRVNIAVSKALSRFNDIEGKATVSAVQHQLYHHYGYPEFKHLKFSRAHAKQTGLSQINYQRKRAKIQHQRELHQQRESIRRQHIRQSKARNRRYHRNYQRYYRNLRRIKKQEHKLDNLKVAIRRAKREQQIIYHLTSYANIVKTVFNKGYGSIKETEKAYNNRHMSKINILKANIKQATRLAKNRWPARQNVNKTVNISVSTLKNAKSENLSNKNNGVKHK